MNNNVVQNTKSFKNNAMSKNKFHLETKGYGYLANSVMENEKISIGAKAFYAYLISKIGIKDSCFPSNRSVMQSLGITIVTLRKYKNELESNELLVIEERKQKSGRIMSNFYYPTKFKIIKKEPVQELGNWRNNSQKKLTPDDKQSFVLPDEESELEKIYSKRKNDLQDSDLNFEDEFDERNELDED